MKIFDCTLRDGANVVGNGFSAELTESMIKNLIARASPKSSSATPRGSARTMPGPSPR